MNSVICVLLLLIFILNLGQAIYLTKKFKGIEGQMRRFNKTQINTPSNSLTENKIPIRKLIKSLPKKMEYVKFLDTMCHSAVTGDMSTQKLLKLAKANGIMIWERMDSGKVKVY